MDQSLPNHQQGGDPQHAAPVGAFRQGYNPTKERVITRGDKDFGRLRRHTRLSQSEGQSSGAEEEWLSSGSYGQSPQLHAMQANGSGLLSSSPRSPNTRGASSFQFKRTRAQQPEQGPAVTTVRASGTPHRQYSRGRNRTSSETEQGGKGSRGPTQRKRGFSETESRPAWDKYGTSHTRNGTNVISNMSGLQCLASENIWFDKQRYDDAEKRFYEGANGPAAHQQQAKTALQQAKGRQQKRQHRNSSSNAGGDQELVTRMKSLELENQTLHKVIGDMRAALLKLESRVTVLESPAAAAVPLAKAAPVQAAPVKPVANGGDAEDDDDIDLFGSDEDDEEAARIKQERVDAYAAKKSKKPALIAKSSILLDVKPWDDETDMAKLEECVRTVQMDGLLWGASKLVPVGYGIKKLQINCVVEDDKVGTDILEEEITKFEDFVQSVDVAAFNKI